MLCTKHHSPKSSSLQRGHGQGGEDTKTTFADHKGIAEDRVNPSPANENLFGDSSQDSSPSFQDTRCISDSLPNVKAIRQGEIPSEHYNTTIKAEIGQRQVGNSETMKETKHNATISPSFNIEKVKFTDGCPNGCQYCYEPKVQIRFYDPIIPKSKNLIQILDMNFLSNPKAKEILKNLPKQKYEFVCGIDYRRLDQEIANLMKEKGFIKVRWAWDYRFSLQKIHKKTLEIFLKAGYKSKELSVFILVNWKIPYIECCMKLDLLKVWRVKVNDCCWDGGYKYAKPVYWTPEQIKNFRHKCRKHNQLVLFGIDPEYKGTKEATQ